MTFQVVAGAARIGVAGYDASWGVLFSASSPSFASGGALRTHAFSFRITNPVNLAHLSIAIVDTTNGTTTQVIVAGAWFGAGLPPENPVLSNLRQEYLSRDGGTGAAMRGDLDYGTHHGHNLAMVTPTPAGTDAANVDYANSAAGAAASTRVAKAGDSMSGDLTMTGNKEVLGLPAAPIGGDGAATSKKYVNDQDSARVAKTGDSMSGNLTMTASKEVLDRKCVV
jgi:hypothetical protein